MWQSFRSNCNCTAWPFSNEPAAAGVCWETWLLHFRPYLTKLPRPAKLRGQRIWKTEAKSHTDLRISMPSSPAGLNCQPTAPSSGLGEQHQNKMAFHLTTPALLPQHFHPPVLHMAAKTGWGILWGRLESTWHWWLHCRKHRKNASLLDQPCFCYCPMKSENPSIKRKPEDAGQLKFRQRFPPVTNSSVSTLLISATLRSLTKIHTSLLSRKGTSKAHQGLPASVSMASPL